MKSSRVLLAVAIGSLLVPTATLRAQGYRVRIDSRFQSASYRGVRLDSVLATAVTTGADGGLVSPDGYAVTCGAGATYCSFFRRGRKRTGGPFVTTADVSLWDLGVPGLSIRGRGRVGLDVGDEVGGANVWPGTEPAAQLVEGYFEYAQELLTVRGGRQHVASRFGYTGFDGGRGSVRLLQGDLTASLYGGWSLARGVALPLTSPALNPLDEFRPGERGLLLGGDLGWRASKISGRVRYERQTDPESDGLVSERTGADVVVRVQRGVTLTGGVDYDLAQGFVGSAEGALALAPADMPLTLTVGGRRYRPHFELWTIWGAFSPVPYHAGFATVAVRVMDGLQLRANGEVFGYVDTEAANSLVPAEDGGHRIGIGGTYTHSRDLVVRADYHLDKGVGGRTLGVDGSVTWRPIDGLAVSGQVANLRRALEFRFSDADVWMFGATADYVLDRQVRVFAGASYFNEERDRTDQLGFSWNQLRLNVGVRLSLSSGADVQSLPPAILRIPEGGGR